MTTEQRIIEAAEKLEAEGTNPTQVTVREALGGGSFATIGPVLKKWKADKKKHETIATVQAPQAVGEAFDYVQGLVWNTAIAEADQRLAAEREALHRAQEQADADVREQQETVKTLEAEAEEYQRTIEGLEEAGRSLDVERHNAQAELAAVKEKAKAENRELTEIIIKETEWRNAAEARADRAETLHREALDQSRADLAALKKEHKAELAQIRDEYKAEIEELKKDAAAQVKAAEKDAQEQAKRAEKAEKDAQQRAAGEQACQSRLESAQRELEQMQKRMAKLEDRADTATQEAAELRGEVKALREAAKGEDDEN